jgi:hypothetical protein
MTHSWNSQMRKAGLPAVNPGASNTPANSAPTPLADNFIGASIERVRAEYREMPGLSLTIRQAERLWGLEPSACRALFDVLHASGFLRRTSNGGYVRADRG